MSISDDDRLAGRKPDADGRFRFTLALEEIAARALYDIADADGRSISKELSYLVMERARELGLDAPGHVS